MLLLNAVGFTRCSGGKYKIDSPFRNHYCKSKGNYVFTLWTQLNETRVNITFNFENTRSRDRLQYHIDYHSKFAVIDQETPNTQCVTIIADELFRKLKQDISIPSVAINGKFYLTISTVNGSKSSPSIPIKDILKQRISEKRRNSDTSETHKNPHHEVEPRRSEPALIASFPRNGIMDNPNHYAFELVTNDGVRPFSTNTIELIFETDNWKLPPIPFTIFPKKVKKLEYVIQETEMSYIIIFEVQSLVQYLIFNVYPRDIKLTTGSIRLLISPRGDGSNSASVGYTSEAVQVSDLVKGIGFSEEYINELHSLPDKKPRTKWQLIRQITYLVLIAIGSLVITMHVLNLAT